MSFFPPSSARLGAAFAATLLLAACASVPAPGAATGPSAATPATQARQQEVAKRYDLSSEKALNDAGRGLIAAPKGQIRTADGRVVWDFDSFSFIQGDAPDTVNPSLWRQALLNNQAGLFKVTEGIWQLRGFDLANLTLIEGRTGWIVVDPLTTRETAAAALAFARQHLGDKAVTAIVFTHSHVDHFGGALGVLSAREVAERKVPVVAPAGFMQEATSENVMMGPAMTRRAGYMYGAHLERSATGLVDNGLGKAPAMGQVGILAPTVQITEARQELVLDGVRFVFHNMPGAEAPAELTFSLPERRAFGGAELVAQTLHNLYTLRGAKVRDALAWAGHIDTMLEQARDADVLFTQHHWPVWGRAQIADFLTTQRDVYRYIHDQTVRGMNQGKTAGEIAETLALPRSLDRHLSVHGYYGSVKHNVRAVYQHYLGWFDAHPAQLDPLPPVQAAQRYVALAGGADAALRAAQGAYDAGDYRWCAELLRHVVLADSGNARARELQARAFEQLGYQAESASWRNFYLVGAHELRASGAAVGQGTAGALRDMLPHIPTERFLEAMATSLDGPRADGVAATINLAFTDTGERWGLWLENAVLHHRPGAAPGAAQVTLALPRTAFLGLLSGAANAQKLVESGAARVEGDPRALQALLGLLTRPAAGFPIVTR